MLFPCLSNQKVSMYRKMSVDSGAGGSGSSVGSSAASLNVNVSGQAGPSSVFTTPKLKPTSSALITLNVDTATPENSSLGTNSGKDSPGSSDSGVAGGGGSGAADAASIEKGLGNIHITENPISTDPQTPGVLKGEGDSSGNPVC